MSNYKCMAIAIKYDLPMGVSPDVFIQSGLQALRAVPGFKKIQFISPSDGTTNVVFSFHSTKIPAVNTWRSALSKGFGEQFASHANLEESRSVMERFKMDLNRLGQSRSYQLVGEELVEEPRTLGKRSRAGMSVDLGTSLPSASFVPSISDPSRASPREHVSIPDGSGAMRTVVVRQATLELLPVSSPVASASPGKQSQVASKASPAHASTPVRTAGESPFNQGDYMASILKFLNEKQPWHNPKDRYDFPMGSAALGKLLPPVVIKDKFVMETKDGVAAEVLEVLKSLNSFFRAKEWNGIWKFLYFKDMQQPYYHCPPEHTLPGCCNLEFFRRALKMEEGIRTILIDIRQGVANAPSLVMIPNASQALARLILSHGCGTFGVGKDFYTAPPDNDPVLAKLKFTSSADDRKLQEIKEILETLRSLRAYACKLYYLVSPLDWTLSTVAFLFHHRHMLVDLRNPDSALQFEAAIRTEWEERKEIYSIGFKPIAKYGALLNKLFVALKSFAGVFNELKTPGVDFSKHPKLLSLTDDGRLKGLNMQPLTKGLLDPSAPKGLLPFPLDMADAVLMPLENATDFAVAQQSKEDGWVLGMLGECGVDPARCQALICMRNARGRIASILENDSWMAELTRVLPPTSSMPHAVFSPAELYKQL